jgi:ATP-dependent DNA ligase
LSERQRDLVRLCNKSRKAVPCLRLIESFPEGPALLEWCSHYQLEGIVSKRLSAPYTSGLSRSWVKIKCDGWRVANQFRHRMFEGRKKLTEVTERNRALIRKREELALVRERLAGPDLSPDMARELTKQEGNLEREISELERLS